MKVTRKIEVTKEEFFDYLEESIINIANTNSDGKRVYTKEDIKEGFTIDAAKNPKTKMEKTKIIRYDRGSKYVWTTRVNYDTITSTFLVEDTEGGINVTYEQIYPSYDNQKMNKFIRGFSDILMLSRMTNMIYDAQKAIVSRRPGVFNPAYEQEQKFKQQLHTQSEATQRLGKKLFDKEK